MLCGMIASAGTNRQERPPGRGLRAFGVRQVAAMTVLVFTSFALVLFVQLRPDYLHPTELGTDVSTYLAAGQRLIAGHEIYALAPGDRPVPIWPAFWTVPLVGPPTIAVLWAPLAVLPPLLAIYAWWLAAFAATAATFVWTIARGRLLVVIAAGILSFSTIITALTGNVNGLLIGALAAVWFLSQGPRTTRRDVAIGILVAVATSVKIGPALFGIWLLATGRWRAAAAAVAAGVVLALVTLVVAGPEIVPEYLRIAADTVNRGVTPLSAGGILQGLGFARPFVVVAPVGVALICAALAIALRHHPRVAFSVVAVGATFAVPVVRFELLSALLLALIPWTTMSAADPAPVQEVE